MNFQYFVLIRIQGLQKWMAQWDLIRQTKNILESSILVAPLREFKGHFCEWGPQMHAILPAITEEVNLNVHWYCRLFPGMLVFPTTLPCMVSLLVYGLHLVVLVVSYLALVQASWSITLDLSTLPPLSLLSKSLRWVVFVVINRFRFF